MYSARFSVALHAYSIVIYSSRAGSLQKILLLLALHLNHYMVPVRPCSNLTWFVTVLAFIFYSYIISSLNDIYHIKFSFPNGDNHPRVAEAAFI